MTADNQVGFLVPLNPSNLEEQKDSSIPKISLAEGINYVGRNCIPVIDKRLSRKHLTLNISANGSAEILVEGTNPVVVRARNERKKLLSGEKCTIGNGDVLEMIPGHYLFKYLIAKNMESSSKQKRPLNKESNSSKDQAYSSKKTRNICEDTLVRKDNLEYNNSSEGIQHFRISQEKLHATFRLLRVKELPEWANTNAVSISDVIQGNVLVAILSNYMVDIDWLLSACPMLKKVPHVLVVHGEGDGTLEYMKRNKPSNWILHKPPLPISYGTHHSKAMLLVYPQGVRVIVHTANLIYVDWNNKSQGLWMQDFPWKDQNSASKGCGFESDLIDYLSVLKWPEFNANIPSLGSVTINSSFFKKFNYSSAVTPITSLNILSHSPRPLGRPWNAITCKCPEACMPSSSGVRLIASVPGYHSGSNFKKWGHMKLRTVLQECTFEKEFHMSPLVCQFSSLGSLDEKWMAELTASMSAGVTEEKKPLGLGKPLIIWPTVEDVRCSLEGYAAGNAIPSPVKNVEKEFLKKYWAKWKASHTGRCHAMPHIKTFTRYNGQNLAWFLLTSANLSKAAWGALQKNSSQLMIRSYELGVLFLPFSGNHCCEFSCTYNGNHSEAKSESSRRSEVKRTKLVTLAWKGNRNAESTEVIQLPIPYELPPKLYSSEDVPWSWDRQYTQTDVYGQVWPRQVQLYTCQDS